MMGEVDRDMGERLFKRVFQCIGLALSVLGQHLLYGSPGDAEQFRYDRDCVFNYARAVFIVLCFFEITKTIFQVRLD